MKRIAKGTIAILATLVVGNISLAGTKNTGSTNSSNEFIKRATGRFKLVSGPADDCLSSNFQVKYHTKKEAVWGSKCGAVLWASSSDDPMGASFCRVDSSDVQGPVILTDSETEPLLTITAAQAGKTDPMTAKIRITAKDNTELFTDAEVVEITSTLKVTDIGIDMEDAKALTDGTIKTTKCSYKKIK